MPKRRRNQRTEHRARIAPPGEFRPRSFRTKRIAPGVQLIVAKRPGARTTETAAVRFDAREFTPDQARAWLTRYGYRPIAFEAANPATSPAPAPNVTPAAAAAPAPNVTPAPGADPNPCASSCVAWARVRELEQQLAECQGREVNPRLFVELGRARELVCDTGRAYQWTIGDDWRVLTPAGAEHLPPGQGRLFIVPPPADKRGEPAPEPGRGADTFEQWHGFEPSRMLETDVPLVEEFTTKIGSGRSIVYRSHKWTRKRVDYEHQFSRRLAPDVLIVGTVEAPRAVLVRGGEFRVTARGLVD